MPRSKALLAFLAAVFPDQGPKFHLRRREEVETVFVQEMFQCPTFFTLGDGNMADGRDGVQGGHVEDQVSSGPLVGPVLGGSQVSKIKAKLGPTQGTILEVNGPEMVFHVGLISSRAFGLSIGFLH